MIGINNIHLSFGGRQILKGVTLSIQDEECIAVVGPNGCGKSTLLRIIAGQEEADAGEIHMPNRTSIGYLPQEANLGVDRTLEEELLDAFGPVRAALAEMSDLEHDMANLDPKSPNYEGILERYSDLAHLVEHQDGYSLEVQVRRVAAGLGFKHEDFERYCSEFSGGWQMRVLLAKVLLQKPDVLLLDEPTNHLDLETMLWLEEWIRTCRRTVIMVSHERSFMDRLVNRVVCLEQGEADIYRGDYSHYVTQSAIKRDAMWNAYTRQLEEIEAVEAFIRKFRYNAARAAQVQSRVKQLEKVERLEPPFHPTAIHFDFPPAPPSYRDVVTLEGVSHSYGDHEVLHDINLTIMRGEKVGLVGVNGAGKSTLLRLISERETPTQGRCAIGGKVSPAYFAQYDVDSLISNQALLQALESNAPTGAAGRARDVLGAFLFSGDDVEKPLRALSGGERTRFRLAQMLFSPANLLILDEPTNHLDVTSRATVEEALRDYSGTVIVVSHDPVFMNCVTDRIVEIIDGKLHTYPGCYNDYLAYKEKLIAEQAAGDGMDTLSTGAPKLSISPGPSTSSRKNEVHVPEPEPIDPKEQRRLEREAQKARERKVRQIERAIDAVESEIQEQERRTDELNFMMADPAMASDYSKLAPLTEEHRRLTAKHTETIAKWESLQEELEEQNSE